jgi:hypothetical protein
MMEGLYEKVRMENESNTTTAARQAYKVLGASEQRRILPEELMRSSSW